MNPSLTLRARWALLSKPQADSSDYRVLVCSDGPEAVSWFERVVRDTLFGTPPPWSTAGRPGETLPWISFGACDAGTAAGDGRWVTVSVTDWNSPAQATWDSSGRRSATTRCFLVPYAEVARHHVGLVSLWNAVRPVQLPSETRGETAPVLIEAQTDHLERTARTVDRLGFRWVAATAAAALESPLALTAPGDRFALVRIGTIDAIAALLPFGYRATLTASTWAPDATATDPWICYTRGSSTRRLPVHEGDVPTPASPRARAHLARLQLLHGELGTLGLLRTLAERTAPVSFPGVVGARLRARPSDSYPKD
ncbi:hypothetical protein ACH4S8_20180 [Streptomyces sp. NPDC021080]|uniref:hypothetical protein n=1 Tax=Streptomyces sp. NPDC021080 TaxID=3365110 RepID=UPI0037AE2B02